MTVVNTSRQKAGQPQQVGPQELLSRSQVAERLLVCRHTVARYTKLGLLPVVVINRRVLRYRPEDLDALIARSTYRLSENTTYEHS
jgi:hypothetical protein